MIVTKRIAVQDYTITDAEGTSFTVECGKEYTTSTATKDGKVLVCSRYWVRVPISVFGLPDTNAVEEPPASPPADTDRKEPQEVWCISDGGDPDRACGARIHNLTASGNIELEDEVGVFYLWREAVREAADAPAIAHDFIDNGYGKLHCRRCRVGDYMPAAKWNDGKCPAPTRSREEAQDELVSRAQALKEDFTRLGALQWNVEARLLLGDFIRAALSRPSSPAMRGWQPIETAPKDGTPFLICWAPSLKQGERKPVVEMVGGWDEYEECRSYGEPEAYGWHPLPMALVSPMSSHATQLARPSSSERRPDDDDLSRSPSPDVPSATGSPRSPQTKGSQQ